MLEESHLPVKRLEPRLPRERSEPWWLCQILHRSGLEVQESLHREAAEVGATGRGLLGSGFLDSSPGSFPGGADGLDAVAALPEPGDCDDSLHLWIQSRYSAASFAAGSPGSRHFWSPSRKTW